ncbi:CLUMA_CG009246, isoform A [Clunio marinus]|uniref:CLUMA_CG009246, isoform A n=1 Tax=Clunio marinus TaxID=568069 RepID=A0A1J1I663_9DIPT|nr:CLUMA_CG009246, isoform A [Clunio marinus]
MFSVASQSELHLQQSSKRVRLDYHVKVSKFMLFCIQINRYFTSFMQHTIRRNIFPSLRIHKGKVNCFQRNLRRSENCKSLEINFNILAAWHAHHQHSVDFCYSPYNFDPNVHASSIIKVNQIRFVVAAWRDVKLTRT